MRVGPEFWSPRSKPVADASLPLYIPGGLTFAAQPHSKLPALPPPQPPRVVEPVGMLSPRLDDARLPFDAPRPSPRRHQRAPPRYADPSSRAEVTALASKLEEALALGGSTAELERLWQGVELELIRQVYVHCAERGELFDAVRRQRDTQQNAMRRKLAVRPTHRPLPHRVRAHVPDAALHLVLPC